MKITHSKMVGIIILIAAMTLFIFNPYEPIYQILNKVIGGICCFLSGILIVSPTLNERM